MQLVAHSVATYAQSFEGFPKRVPGEYATTKSEDDKYLAYDQSIKYHGSKLYI